MSTITKIKISDDGQLRMVLDNLYQSSSQVQLCKFAISTAWRILEMAKLEENLHPDIVGGIMVNQQWQDGIASQYQVRQAGFKIHKLARESENEIVRTALRVVGQAVAVGHMCEHAMVACDYAIKVVNLIYPNDKEAIIAERKWQIERLSSIVSADN